MTGFVPANSKKQNVVMTSNVHGCASLLLLRQATTQLSCNTHQVRRTRLVSAVSQANSSCLPPKTVHKQLAFHKNSIPLVMVKDLLLVVSLVLALSAHTQETLRVYLSGRGKDDAVLWEFMCTKGARAGFWTNLPVPSNWEMHGFGTLNYKKDSPNALDEKGLYRLDFVAPADWVGQRVFLVFDGVMTDTTAMLNGELVGQTHQGGFYRFRYEVTKHIRLGATNRLEVTVAKHSANESVNRAERLADYWVFGGIYRPVYLEVVPPQFIERVAIDARHDGAFAMDVFVRGITSADAELTVEAQIMTLDHKPLGNTFSTQVPVVTSASPDRLKVNLQTRITAPQPWTAETPNLYLVEVRLKHGEQTLHRYTQRFGFRTFEVRDGDGLYLNGRKIILKGVNRHSFWPDSGRCLSEAVHRLDIETIKDMNANAVRMSHYPPDADFLDLCDELGLYVLDELAGWHNHYDDQVGRKLVEEMVTRDVNHPCILFWCNGNEGGFNTNLDTVFAEFDPQKRRVLHPWAPFNGINTAHYLAYDTAQIAASGAPMYFNPKQGKECIDTNLPNGWIYMPTEFLHGMFDGGAGAGLDDYWRMMMSYTNCAGGFIWALTDDGLKRPDTGGIDTAGNQAPDGIVGPYRQREGSFYTIKEIWSPIQVRREPNGTFTLENHYSFTDAAQCRFTWQIRELIMGLGTIVHDRVIDQGSFSVTNLPPGGKATIELPIPKDWEHKSWNVLALHVDDPHGRRLWTWVWPSSNFGGSYPLPNISSLGPPTVHETAETFEIEAPALGRAGFIAVRISKQTGALIGVDCDGQPISLTGPRLVVGHGKLRSIQKSNEQLDVVVTARFDGELKEVVWRIRNDGMVMCEYTYSCVGTNHAHGVVFDYPEPYVKRKRWLGNGPYRVWKNRLRGVTLGIWENEYNNTITGWRDWIYPEFKGCFANVYQLQLDTTEGQITVIPNNIPFVQVLTPEQPPDELAGKTKVLLPKCGLGFLHAIPPIGSKFKDASTTGPQGQLNVANGTYSGSVTFSFTKAN